MPLRPIQPEALDKALADREADLEEEEAAIALLPDEHMGPAMEVRYEALKGQVCVGLRYH